MPYASSMHAPAEVDVLEELSQANVGSLHRWLGAMMASLTLFDGYDTFNPSYVIHYVTGPWRLVPSQAGMLVSSGLVGFLIGAALHGMVADKIGRRITLLCGLWITNAFTLATALFGDTFAVFCLVRVFTGVGLGVLLPLATTYINELAPRRVANSFSLWAVAFGWALGGTLAGLVGVFLTPIFGWKVLYWIGSLSIPLTIALHFFLPESIQFMALRRRREDIRGLLSRLRPEREAVYRVARLVLPPSRPRVSPVRALLVPEYRRTTLIFWLVAFLSLFCIFGLGGWIPSVMMKRGETFAASFGFGAMLQIMSFVGALTCGRLADRSGSNRGVLALWWALGGVALLALIVLDGHAANIVCTAAGGFFIMGAQFVLNNFTARSYETSVRATGVGMELSVGRIGAILGPFVVGAMQQAYSSPKVMFGLIGAAALMAAVAIASIGPQAGRR
jgi:MFS family permease